MAGNSCLGADDYDPAVGAGVRRGVGSRFDDADHFHARSHLDLIESESGGGVTGDDQQLSAVILEVVHGADGVVRHRGRGL